MRDSRCWPRDSQRDGQPTRQTIMPPLQAVRGHKKKLFGRSYEEQKQSNAQKKMNVCACWCVRLGVEDVVERGGGEMSGSCGRLAGVLVVCINIFRRQRKFTTRRDAGIIKDSFGLTPPPRDNRPSQRQSGAVLGRGREAQPRLILTSPKFSKLMINGSLHSYRSDNMNDRGGGASSLKDFVACPCKQRCKE